MSASIHRPVIAIRLSSCQRCGIQVNSKSWDFQEFVQPDSGRVTVGDFISIFESREAYYLTGPLGVYENVAGRVVGITSSSRSHILFAIRYTARHTVTLRVPFHLSQVGRLQHIQHALYRFFDLGRHHVTAPVDDSPAPSSMPAYVFPVLAVQDQDTDGLKASLEAPSSPYSTVSNLPHYYSSSILSYSSSLPSYSSRGAGTNRSGLSQPECWRRSGLPGVDNRDYMPFSPRFIHHITSQQAVAPNLSGLYEDPSEIEEDALSSVRVVTSEVDTLTVTSPESSLWDHRSAESSSRGETDARTSSSDSDRGSHRSGVVFANLVPTNSLESLYVNIQ